MPDWPLRSFGRIYFLAEPTDSDNEGMTPELGILTRLRSENAVELELCYRMSAKPEKSAVRLAQQENLGAVLFNCYQWLTQLTSLYGEASPHELDEARRKIWDGVLENALEDISRLCNVWNTLVAYHGKEAKAPVKVSAAAVLRNSARVQRVYPMFNEWLPLGRWARFLMRVEDLLGAVLRTIDLPVQALESECRSLAERSRERTDLLRGLSESYERLNRELNLGIDPLAENI